MFWTLYWVALPICVLILWFFDTVEEEFTSFKSSKKRFTYDVKKIEIILMMLGSVIPVVNYILLVVLAIVLGCIYYDKMQMNDWFSSPIKKGDDK